MFFNALLIFSIDGCRSDNNLKLEKWTDGKYQAIPFSTFDINGRRDGENTFAYIIFTFINGAKIEIDLEITYNPLPILKYGEWRLVKNGLKSNDVFEENLIFLGGQGEAPSIGGRFILNLEGQSFFRVTLPLMQVYSSF